MELKRWDLVDGHELKLMALRCFLIGVFGSIFAVVFFLYCFGEYYYK